MGYVRLDMDYFFEMTLNRDKLQGHQLKLYKKEVKLYVGNCLVLEVVLKWVESITRWSNLLSNCKWI